MDEFSLHQNSLSSIKTWYNLNTHLQIPFQLSASNRGFFFLLFLPKLPIVLQNPSYTAHNEHADYKPVQLFYNMCNLIKGKLIDIIFLGKWIKCSSMHTLNYNHLIPCCGLIKCLYYYCCLVIISSHSKQHLYITFAYYIQ